jgi:hypothetical protein
VRLVLLAAAALATAGSGGLAFWKTVVDVPDSPRRLDAADLDGDGDVDLFVLADAAGDAASLQVLLNHNGEFSPGWSATQPTLGVWDLPWDVDLADTDGDGDADVLYLVEPGSSPQQRFNDGDGSFTGAVNLPVYAPRSEQEPADMDDDGDIDIVYYEEDLFGYFGTLEGFGDGGFEFDFATETWGLGDFDPARRFEIADLDGDGLKDAVMASKNGLQVIPSGPPAPGHSLPHFLLDVQLYATACADVALVDLDGNSTLDLVATVPSLHSIVVFRTLPAGGFSAPRFYTAGATPRAIAAADLDLDGHADVVVTNPTTSRINVLLGVGDGTFGAAEDFRVGKQPVDIVAADFDHDGDSDLAVACAEAGHVTVLINESALPHALIEGWR